eukprot:Clim_evm59s144 gene=Clim_evmTU59s144
MSFRPVPLKSPNLERDRWTIIEHVDFTFLEEHFERNRPPLCCIQNETRSDNRKLAPIIAALRLEKDGYELRICFDWHYIYTERIIGSPSLFARNTECNRSNDEFETVDALIAALKEAFADIEQFSYGHERRPTLQLVAGSHEHTSVKEEDDSAQIILKIHCKKPYEFKWTCKLKRDTETNFLRTVLIPERYALNILDQALIQFDKSVGDLIVPEVSNKRPYSVRSLWRSCLRDQLKNSLPEDATQEASVSLDRHLGSQQSSTSQLTSSQVLSHMSALDSALDFFHQIFGDRIANNRRGNDSVKGKEEGSEARAEVVDEQVDNKIGSLSDVDEDIAIAQDALNTTASLPTATTIEQPQPQGVNPRRQGSQQSNTPTQEPSEEVEEDNRVRKARRLLGFGR